MTIDPILQLIAAIYYACPFTFFYFCFYFCPFTFMPLSTSLVGLIRFPVRERLLAFRLYPNRCRIKGLGAMGTTVERLKCWILRCFEI